MHNLANMLVRAEVHNSHFEETISVTRDQVFSENIGVVNKFTLLLQFITHS